VSLADKRAETFGDALFLKVSTPKLKGFSRIEKLMEQTDARHWFVPCPKCGFFQTLKWENIHWVENQPETAWLECEHCKQRLSDAERIQAVVHGEWRPTLPFRGKRGYFLNGFNRIIGLKAHHQSYLHEFVDEYLTARKDDQTYQVWVNTVKTEAYEQRVERVEHHSLFERRENYGPDIPAEVCVLTAGVDIQNNRIEAELVGWGVGEESWSLDYRVFPGDVETDAPWAALDAWLLLPRFNVHRQPMRVLATGVDTDASTQQAYKFCRARWARHVCALKGKGGPGLPLVALPRRSGVTKVKLYTVGSDTAKAIVYSRLAVAVPGKGYCHFPMQAPEEYFRQLTSEVIVVKRQSGRMWRAFQLPTGARNEALDCRCYALAAVHICQPNLEIIKVRLSKAAPPAPQEPQPEATEKPVPESPKVPQVPPAPVQPAGARTRKARPPRSPSWLGGTFQSWKL
jgi:phage terminase large subunit GpA-like protein